MHTTRNQQVSLHLHLRSSCLKDPYNDAVYHLGTQSFRWVKRLQLTPTDSILSGIAKIIFAALTLVITIPTAIGYTIYTRCCEAQKIQYNDEDSCF